MEDIKPPLSLYGLTKRLIFDKLLDEQTALVTHQRARAMNVPLMHYILQHQLIEPAALIYCASAHFGLPILDLSAFDANCLPIEFIKPEHVKKYQILPIFKRGQNLFIAVVEPTHQIALDEIKFYSGLNIHCILTYPDQLIRLINQVINHVINEFDEINIEIASEVMDSKTQNLSQGVDDAPLIRLVYKIMLDAVNKKASDIHFEPYEKSYRLRIRLDGILHELPSPNLHLANRICARIKIMAGLDISERRIPQDGRFRMHLSSNKNIDFRVSTCPTLYGEKIVVRILAEITQAMTLNNLGLEPLQKYLFLQMLTKPQGMIVVTGPTGSGKTFTLYTALNRLNTPCVNISTVEDPVEIHVAGINQVNIHSKIGLTFPIALRALLRQDPDIIMVGEIRDQETAEIAIKAAQTGHLVLSTLHTNNAAETLIRLLNMGLPHYHIATSITLIIAQRLLRKLCENCKYPTKTNLPDIPIPPQQSIYTANINGCIHCTKGYKDRIAVFEVMPITPSLSHLMLTNSSAARLQKLAIQEGMLTLYQASLLKLLRGETSLEEIYRVIYKT